MITQAAISVPALYFGVCIMLQALFRDPEQLAKTEAVAGEFVHLWPQYAAAGAYVLFRRRRL